MEAIDLEPLKPLEILTRLVPAGGGVLTPCNFIAVNIRYFYHIYLLPSNIFSPQSNIASLQVIIGMPLIEERVHSDLGARVSCLNSSGVIQGLWIWKCWANSLRVTGSGLQT